MNAIMSSSATPVAGVPRRLSPETRRAKIVDAAVAFFAEVGLEGSTRELSQRAGVTQPLLYKYFDSKASLLEAVFERVYMDRLSPDWPGLITDRAHPIRERMISFYVAYADAVFTYEWMRIFMFSGLAGEQINTRYLDHLRASMLEPLLREITEDAKGARRPELEDVWNLHGSIVYLGIRKFVYQAPVPVDFRPQIERAVDRFLRDFDIPRRIEPTDLTCITAVEALQA
ncbi:MAG TPA: TetR/AcrR family transcriptional regulator [Saliniramus sp.]|nr:TetR/AcrR family transcriptional regulator [Saliniramus sp.]